MKIVNCVKLKERKDLRKKWCELRKEERERRRERNNREETKRIRQGSDSVFLACASLH